MTGLLSAVSSNRHSVLPLMLAVPGIVSQNELDSALLVAVKNGFTDCVRILLENGADVCISDKAHLGPFSIAAQNPKLSEVLELLIELKKSEVNETGRNGGTALHVAARVGNVKAVDLLLSRGNADSNIRDNSGATPLITAVRFCNNVYDIVKLLIKRRETDVNIVDLRQRNALHYAVVRLKAVELLTTAGCDVNVQDEDGNTPLILAASEGLCNMVKTIASSTVVTCNTNVKNEFHKTAFHILASKGHACCLKELCDNNAIIDIPDSRGHTPLREAVIHGRAKAVKFLIQKNHSFDDIDVMDAYRKGHMDVVKMLVISGCEHRELGHLLDEPVDEELQTRYPEMLEWLHEILDNPFPLKAICRLKIKHLLGGNLENYVHQIHLPRFLIDFILMTDLDEYA